MVSQGTVTSELANSNTARGCLTICFLLILFSCHLFSLNCKQFKNHQASIPALYIFGDSVLDAGNNNNFSTKYKANFLPFGIDFEGGNPTGRFTNGKTIADFIALRFGLPLTPPYLGLSEFQRRNITTGINYASAGGGILPETAHYGGLCLAFDNQTELFQRTVENDLPKHFKKQSELKMHLSKSLFVIFFGINDFKFYQECYINGTKQWHLTPEAFGQLLLNEFSIRLQRLYNLGARKFLVNNMPPLGCVPSETIKMSHEGVCNEDKNKLVTFYNRKLPQMLKSLQSQLPGTLFTHSNFYKFLLQLRASAKRFGMIEIGKPCCPENYNGTLGCHANATVCKTRDTHLFFDENHPNQIANGIYVERCFDDFSNICTTLSEVTAISRIGFEPIKSIAL